LAFLARSRRARTTPEIWNMLLERAMTEPDRLAPSPIRLPAWARLEAQLQLFADRGMTLRQAIYTYAPPTETTVTATWNMCALDWVLPGHADGRVRLKI